MSVLLDEVRRVAAEADCLYTGTEIEACLDRMADVINARFGDEELLVLCTMNGAVVLAGKLLPRLKMPVALDYLHATRYQHGTQGGEISWLRKPAETLASRNVLVLDDIFDEGITLAAILDFCRQAGTRELVSAVLVEKLDAARVDIKPDVIGLTVPNRYIFGYGMDYKGYLRNAAGIYAVKGM
jgi:hypoxanthine phosphoribosyltransferase